MNASTTYDLAVVGAGSGGIGAAVAAARAGLSVLLLEADADIGGTAVWAGVHCWEMGAGGTGLPFEIYRRMKEIPHGTGIYSIGRHFCWPNTGAAPFPGGESLVDPERTYPDTLRRHGATSLATDEAFCRKHWHGVPFEPHAYLLAVNSLLHKTGRCTVLPRSRVTHVTIEQGRLLSVLINDRHDVSATYWIDATGDGTLSIMAGACHLNGIDPKALFDEPGAPEAPSPALNAVTLIFRIAPRAERAVDPLPPGIPAEPWWSSRFPPMSCTQYPNGDRNCNMLPTMEGREYADQPCMDAYMECRRRVLAYWHYLQDAYPEFRSYRLRWIAPRVGVRDSNRILCEYMLTQNDIMQGIEQQDQTDLIAIADHATDRHGADSAGCGELKQPYGVPYHCLIPQGFRNLLVACRAAGFSSIAASSCRLSRTMMQLGQAAGTAAALANRDGRHVADVDIAALRQALGEQHVQLEWPMTPDLLAYLRDKSRHSDERRTTTDRN